MWEEPGAQGRGLQFPGRQVREAAKYISPNNPTGNKAMLFPYLPRKHREQEHFDKEGQAQALLQLTSMLAALSVMLNLQTVFWPCCVLVSPSLMLWHSSHSGMHLMHKALLFTLRKGQLHSSRAARQQSSPEPLSTHAPALSKLNNNQISCTVL